MSEPPNISSTAPTGPVRRPVRYNTLPAILDDAIFLANHPHQTLGQWNYAQILQHIADNINYSFDGFPFQVNPFIRLIVRLFFKRKLVEGPIAPGFKLPAKAQAHLPEPSIPVATALANLKAAIARFEKHDPQALSPFLGHLTRDEWIKVHLNHAALHMSFVRPA